MSQYSVPPAVTGRLVNLCTSCSETPEPPTCPAITRPPDAPRSTAAIVTGPVICRTLSSQERGRHTRVDRDEQAGRQRQVAGAQREHRRGHVLGQDLLLERGPLGVESAELFLSHAVHRRPRCAPAGREDP